MLVSLLVETGEFAAAARVLDGTVSSDRATGTLAQRRLRLSSVQLQIARGEPERTLPAIECLLAEAPNAAGPRSLPWIALARGAAHAALGHAKAAETDYDAARLGAEELGFLHLLWRTDVALARLLFGTGRPADAVAASARALVSINEIAETLTDDERTAFRRRVLARFPAAAISPGRLNVPAERGAVLRPRELDVLRLVARGLTDAETGEALSLSHRTVGRHLQSIYNKLGVGSRTAAVSVAFERGLIVPHSRA